MRKLLVATAVFASVATSAFAVECTQAEMDKMTTQMKTMTDKTKQGIVTNEMKMAGDMMAKKDMASCAMHLDNATKAMTTSTTTQK